MNISEVFTRIPEELRAKLTPEYIIQSVHGIVLGESTCMECRKVLTHNDYSKCMHCDKPWPRICWADGCNEYAKMDRHVNSKGGVTWYDLEGHCGCAAIGAAKKSRDASESKWRSLYSDQPAIVKGVDNYYQQEPNRRYIEGVINEWYRSGKSDGWSPLYLYGQPGSSKSTIISRIVRRGMMDKVWKYPALIREQTMKAYASKSAGNEEGYDRKWKRLRDADILIIDSWDSARSRGAPKNDMLSSSRKLPGYTDTQLASVAGLLRYRFEHGGKATVFISLIPPMFREFGADVESRWAASNYAGETDPIDYRRRKQPMRGEYCD